MKKNPDDRWLWPAFWFVVAIVIMVLSGCAGAPGETAPVSDGPAWWKQAFDLIVTGVISNAQWF